MMREIGPSGLGGGRRRHPFSIHISKSLGRRVTVEEYTADIRRKRRKWIDAHYDEKEIKEQFGKLKGALPAVTWSGLFSMARGANLITRHSGLIVADVDKMTTAEIQARWAGLVADPHVWFLFMSPTETGIKIFVPVAGLDDQWPVRQGMTQPQYASVANQFQYAAYFAIRNHMLEQHGLQIDGACKDTAENWHVQTNGTAGIAMRQEPADTGQDFQKLKTADEWRRGCSPSEIEDVAITS